MKKLFLLGLFAFLGLQNQSVSAQEINAQVFIQTPKLQIADAQLFKTLENELREFINNTKWTDEVFKTDEKIECSFQLTVVEEISATRFRVNATIQSNRPVYNSGYNSVLFNHQDKAWEFDYAEFEPLEFNENAYSSELTSLVAFYIYIVLGMDFDSFGQEAGNPHFVKAQTIVNNAQTSKNKGWKAFENNRNRYWLALNLLDGQFKPIRQAMYNYHRQGLDKMYSDLQAGRRSVASSLNMIEKFHKETPNSMLVSVFVNSKQDEIIKIFGDSKVPPPDRMKAYNAMAAIDPANLQRYSQINADGTGPKGFTFGGKNGQSMRPTK